MLIVRLPFPDKSLMPNKKNGNHWAKTNNAKNIQKFDGYVLTMQALDQAGPQEWTENIPLSLIYMMPDKRHRDLDNLLAASKAIIDGIAQAIGVDDKRFKPILVDSVLGPKEGGLIAAVGAKIESMVSLEQ